MIKSNEFFLQNLPSTKFIFELKGFTNRMQLTSNWYHAICICRDFVGCPQRPQNDANMTPKIVKSAKVSEFKSFYTIFVQFLIDFVAQNVENFPKG